MDIREELLRLMIKCRNEPPHVGLPIQRALGQILKEQFRTGDTIQRIHAIVQNLPDNQPAASAERKPAKSLTFTADNFAKKPISTVTRRAVGPNGKTEVTEVEPGVDINKRLFAKQKAAKDKIEAEKQAELQEAEALKIPPPESAETTLEDEAEDKAISTKVAAIAGMDLPQIKSAYSNKPRALEASKYLFKEIPEDHKSMGYIPLLKWMIEKAKEHVAG